MNALAVEMFRDDAWKPVAYKGISGPRVSLDTDGLITITYDIGYIQPPWRVLDGDRVVFERAA